MIFLVLSLKKTERLDVSSFKFGISLISVCLVVVDGISASAVKSEEVNPKR